MVARRNEGSGGRWGEHNAERRRAVMDALVELIEESEPGTEISLQDIADRAGLKRSVIYRHFADRKDLDAQTREYLVESYIGTLMPTLDPEDSVRETVYRAVHTYVTLVAAHPRLHRWVEQGPGSHDPSGVIVVAGTKEAVAQRISALFTPAAALFGQADPAIDVAAFAVVSTVDGAVTRWLRTRPGGWDAAQVSRALTDSLVMVLEGHARNRGIPVDADVPIGELLAEAAARY
ncbi:TetR/AcrR family transcriptional regulator [Nocardia sp. NPDC050712]|uniref:TetR/AcrR family transcriptional regulator n=1 Tax=Nocardia sp. NPDC050712 TaxID=3155518 RepID=UPI0033EE2EEA